MLLPYINFILKVPCVVCLVIGNSFPVRFAYVLIMSMYKTSTYLTVYILQRGL